MIPIYAERGKPLCIGREGENNARYVVFDVSHWRAVYGPGTVQLLVQRTGETTPYPAALTVEGSNAIWVITLADTAIPGQFGKAELRYMVDDTLAKSEQWTTIVWDALWEPSETPPEPQQGWVDQVLQAGVDAQDAAKRAETAAIHQPYPNADTGTWWIWDAEKGEYKDSGVSANPGYQIGDGLKLDEATNTLSVDMEVVAQEVIEKLPAYDGELSVDPSFDQQTLSTKGKLMSDDVIVNPIEVSRTSNDQGGTTVYIGGIIDG